jgi:hypothetical protein
MVGIPSQRYRCRIRIIIPQGNKQHILLVVLSAGLERNTLRQSEYTVIFSSRCRESAIIDFRSFLKIAPAAKSLFWNGAGQNGDRGEMYSFLKICETRSLNSGDNAITLCLADGGIFRFQLTICPTITGLLLSSIQTAVVPGKSPSPQPDWFGRFIRPGINFL